MKIGIIANSKKPEIADKVVGFIKGKAGKKNYNILLNIDTFNFLKTKLEKKKVSGLIKVFDDKRVKESFDLLISFGGDGTMLYSSVIAIKTDSPLLGVNFGRLGFLADIDFDALEDFMVDFTKNDYQVEGRMVLEGRYIADKENSFLAVNDIVIDKGGWPRIITLETFVDNKYLSTFSSDGIIVSTTTGSTGYSLSTGGPILVPASECIVLSPICPHTLTYRPIVFPANSVIKIKAVSDHSYISLSSDGHKVFKTPPILELEIRKSKKILKLVRHKNSDYFDTLRKKLIWGYDIRHKL